MSIQNLSYLFHPRSVAVVGASNRPFSIGSVVMRNLLRGGFEGPILPVNPKEQAVAGVFAYNRIESLPLSPDLAVICTPAPTVPDIIDELGRRGTKSAVVITAGLRQEKDASGRTYQELMLDRAAAHHVRLLGPNCVGIIAAEKKLNASFVHIDTLPGKIAFVAQSGALCSSVLDWAWANRVGFSYFVSLGDIADIDFGDVLDYLGGEANTQAILLYIESIGTGRAREFMSAARAAARNKPVIVVKAGRVAEGQRAAHSHTGALAGSDVVYDAAIRRAGMLRVYEMRELFDAAETLARSRPHRGDRLAIVTNGGGPGVLATDALIARGGRLAELSDETYERLDKVLPPTWTRGNPVDLIGDARGDRYAQALKIVMQDMGVDAVLVMNVPTAMLAPEDAARSVIGAVADTTLPLFTNWLGQAHAEPARALFRQAGLPTYPTPDNAVRAFMHVVHFYRNQQALMQTPPSAPADFTPQLDEARRLIRKRLAEGAETLSELDSKLILSAYGIPVVETRIATSTEEAIAAAEQMGYPVVVKLLSPQVTHKSDVGGVVLDIQNRDSLKAAVEAMRVRVAKLRPDATIAGFTVQPMIRRPRAHELILGASVDPIFGPVILFGQGGTAVEIVADRAVALPPMDMALARDLISRTRVAQLLRGYRERPAANLPAIELTLVKVAQLVIDHAEIIELDVNPLLADERGVMAVDARVRIAHAKVSGPDRLAIRPYPKELEEMVTLRDGAKLLARPIRPEDQPAHQRFIARLTPEDIHSRFLGTVRSLEASQMARLTQIDYDREMAFIAVRDAPGGESETLGVVRTVTDPDNQRAEFAIVVRSDTKARGLGFALMQKMIRYCRTRGTREIVGEILPENAAMLQLARDLNFVLCEDPGERLVHVHLALH